MRGLAWRCGGLALSQTGVVRTGVWLVILGFAALYGALGAMFLLCISGGLFQQVQATAGLTSVLWVQARLGRPEHVWPMVFAPVPQYGAMVPVMYSSVSVMGRSGAG